MRNSSRFTGHVFAFPRIKKEKNNIFRITKKKYFMEKGKKDGFMKRLKKKLNVWTLLIKNWPFISSGTFRYHIFDHIFFIFLFFIFFYQFRWKIMSYVFNVFSMVSCTCPSEPLHHQIYTLQYEWFPVVSIPVNG